MRRELFLGLVLAAALGSSQAGGRLKAEDKPAESKAKFVGVNNCKLCHSEDATGNQFAEWKKSRHAGALKTLATPKAKEVAAKQGVTDPEKDQKCLRCHLTGAEAPKAMKARTFKETEGVGCESCHGAGELYAKEEVFKQGKEAAIALGLIEPEEKVCVRCHNKDSPSYSGFDFKSMYEKVKHLNPKKKR
jgi:nitrate/TMAO reductase-like tetraheme cytochrome c subunit